MNDPCVSVVMPCLNEGKTIRGCIEAAKKGMETAGIAGEVVVSDNGSTDDSIAVAESAGARVVRCIPKGYGNALRAGFHAARGEWILMGDADQSYDFSLLPRFWEKIREGFDLVMGSRLKGTIDPGAMPWLHRYIGNPVLSFILRTLFHTTVSDSHCGLRAFRRDALEKMDLRTTGMELASEIVIKSVRARLRIAEVPIHFHKDARDRPPHLRSFRDGWRHLRYMLMMAPNWLFVLPGMALMAGGMVAMFLGGAREAAGPCAGVWAMCFGAMFVLSGVQLVLFGALAEEFMSSGRLAQRPKGWVRRLLGSGLERGLLVASVLILAGLGGDVWVWLRWPGDFPAADAAVRAALRMVVVNTTLLLVGIQLFFASFLLSMLGPEFSTRSAENSGI